MYGVLGASMQAFLEGDLGRLENYFVLGSPERQMIGRYARFLIKDSDLSWRHVTQGNSIQVSSCAWSRLWKQA